MSPSTITVVKADGTSENFDQSKLQESLKNSGADDSTSFEIAEHVSHELVSGMTTADIYRHAFSVLRSKQRNAAARYSLRRSLSALGPTGFPFEKFVGELLKRKGYTVLLDQIVQGKCIDHEMDVVAWDMNRLIMVEAKYHHELAYKSDIKVALYVKARFDDLFQTEFSFGHTRKLNEAWLITNTKFTDKALRYAECAGVKLLGWNYPATGNLHDLIEETGVHPITCLTTISDGQKRMLMEHGIVLCESIRTEKQKLLSFGFDEHLIAQVEAESNALCPS